MLSLFCYMPNNTARESSALKKFAQQNGLEYFTTKKKSIIKFTGIFDKQLLLKITESDAGIKFFPLYFSFGDMCFSLEEASELFFKDETEDVLGRTHIKTVKDILNNGCSSKRTFLFYPNSVNSVFKVLTNNKKKPEI